MVLFHSNGVLNSNFIAYTDTGSLHLRRQSFAIALLASWWVMVSVSIASLFPIDRNTANTAWFNLGAFS